MRLIFFLLCLLSGHTFRVRWQAREDYELLMKQNRNSTISGQDIYITHRCQVPPLHRIPRATTIALAKTFVQ